MTDVALIGDASLATAYSRINRVWLEGLRAAGYRTDGEGALDVLIHHDYSQHFATCDAGAARHRVAVRTWDFGPFPRAWAERIGRDFDRLWVHSEWVREKAIEIVHALLEEGHPEGQSIRIAITRARKWVRHHPTPNQGDLAR